MIAIIGAMSEEIELLLNKMQGKKEKIIAKRTFYEGKISNKNVVVVEAGIGKVNAAITTQCLINYYQPRVIINTGVAGSLNKNVNILDTVIAIDLMYHDFDTTYFDGDELGVVPRMGVKSFFSDKKLNKIIKEVYGKIDTSNKIHFGRIVSGDQFVYKNEIKENIIKYFEPLAVDMESTAIAHTCYQNNIPFVIIRSISDNADGNAHMQYSEFVELSANFSAKLLIEVLSAI